MSDTESTKKGEEVMRLGGGRGPAYPNISLREAVTRATQIKDANALKAVLTPEIVFKIWGFKGSSGASRPVLASMNYYGLLDYVGRGEDRKVKLSDLAVRIVLDKLPDSPARAAALREAAMKPAIHQRLSERFEPPLPADMILEHFLTLECGYSESAAPTIIENFKDTLDYAGLLKPDKLPNENDAPVTEFPDVLAKVGDLVQVEIGGAFQLAKPTRLRAIQEHDGKKWAFVDGSETGIPMEQVIVQAKAPPVQSDPVSPPRLPLDPVDVAPAKGEREWLRGPLSKDASYRLIVSGDLGPKEIGKLIKLLKAQQAVLSDEDDDNPEGDN